MSDVEIKHKSLNHSYSLEPEDSETRASIVKTAEYVKRNGKEFEAKLNVEQFPFLQESNEYHGFYIGLLGHTQSEENTELLEKPPVTAKESSPVAPHSFVFSTTDRNVPKRDLEIVKKTALMCVLNEKHDFLNTLRTKASEHPLLGFLNPRHPLNETFTSFINQYKQVASKEFELGSLFVEQGQMGFLKRCFERAKYMEYSERIEVQEAATQERLKLRFFSYAWDNFEILGKVELGLDDDYAKPLEFDLLRQKTLQHSSTSSTFAVHSTISSTASVDTTVAEKETKPKKKSKMKIRAAGETRIKQKGGNTGTQPMIECPITHKMIPEVDFDKHIQVLLSDPNYTKERHEYEAKNNISNLTLESVHQNVKRLSQNRNSVPTKRQKI
ncbi:LAFA_0G03378g1_1 [Lachancea sp. 'fantastica']|nr:LAFA_0G03378g1_1 [Lachancea sp. 'fantastica']